MTKLTNVFFLISNDLSPVNTKSVSQAYGNKDQTIANDTFNKYKKKGKEKFLKISDVIFDSFHREIHLFQHFNGKKMNYFKDIIDDGIPLKDFSNQLKAGNDFRKQLNVNNPKHFIMQILYKLQHHTVKYISSSYTISKSPSARGFRYGFIKELIKHCSGKKGTALYKFLYTIGSQNGAESNDNNNYNYNNNNNGNNRNKQLYNKPWQQGWRNGFKESAESKRLKKNEL